MFANITKFSCRTVSSFPDLIDKIMVFDDEFSDHLIELLKLITSFREGIDLNTPMYYGGLKQAESGETALALMVRIDNQIYSRAYPVPQCLEEPKAVMPMLTMHFGASEMWPKVDRHYLLKALEKAGITDFP